MRDIKKVVLKYQKINDEILSSKVDIQSILEKILHVEIPTQDIEIKEKKVYFNTSSGIKFEIVLNREKIEKELLQIDLSLAK